METDDFLKKLNNTYSNPENDEPEKRVEGKNKKQGKIDYDKKI